MKRLLTYTHEFLDSFPASPEPGVLYVSIPFETTMHLCMCGCALEVHAPLSPTDWSMRFNGATVSLSPSIGNWELSCSSHYVLKNGEVRWAGQWTPAQIKAGRARDLARKDAFHSSAPTSDEDLQSGAPGDGPFRRAWRILRRA